MRSDSSLAYSSEDAAIDKADAKKTLPIYMECLKPSWRLIIVDFFVIGSAIFVKDLGIDAVIFGYIIIAVLSYTVDYIQSGNMQSSQILIFSRSHYEEIAEAITTIRHRGATLLDSKGWYTKENGYVVLVVCRKRESSQILKIVRSIDPDAFISVGAVMGVYGKGFEPLGKI